MTSASLILLHQPLHHPPQFGRRVAGNHLDIANTRPPQRFLLDRVARGGGVSALEMRSALVLDSVQRAALLVEGRRLTAAGKGEFPVSP